MLLPRSTNAISTACIILFCVGTSFILQESSSFTLISPRVPKKSFLSNPRNVHHGSSADDTLDSREEEWNPRDRRAFLSKSAALIPFLATTAVHPDMVSALVNEKEKEASPQANIDCLLDLPPVTPDSVRVYLCRHGQTENNRLRLVQGSRIDPPINDTGSEQARQIGKALSRLPPELLPRAAFSSNLRRAKETAALAIANSGTDRGGQEDMLQMSPLPLSVLGEIDFGPVDGKKVSEAMNSMKIVAGSWAIGMVDNRPDGGGESGREVLNKVMDSIQFLSECGQEHKGEPILAVSHGAYLRTLLAMSLDIPLTQAASLGQKNGCINVLDISTKKRVNTSGSKSNLFGGLLAAPASWDFPLSYPEVKVIRVNETRHLDGLIF